MSPSQRATRGALRPSPPERPDPRPVGRRWAAPETSYTAPNAASMRASSPRNSTSVPSASPPPSTSRQRRSRSTSDTRATLTPPTPSALAARKRPHSALSRQQNRGRCSGGAKATPQRAFAPAERESSHGVRVVLGQAEEVAHRHHRRRQSFGVDAGADRRGQRAATARDEHAELAPLGGFEGTERAA